MLSQVNSTIINQGVSLPEFFLQAQDVPAHDLFAVYAASVADRIKAKAEARKTH